jgi:hypothetical protein
MQTHTPRLQELLYANDFIGVSGYGSGYPLKGLSWPAMEIPLQTLAYELGFFKISLKDLMKGKPVVYVEQVLSCHPTHHCLLLAGRLHPAQAVACVPAQLACNDLARLLHSCMCTIQYSPSGSNHAHSSAVPHVFESPS